MHKPAVLPLLTAGLLLTGCESTPERGPGAPAVVQSETRCDGRAVTGSRIVRCDTSDVHVIDANEIRATGLPGAGAGRGAETRGGPAR